VARQALRHRTWLLLLCLVLGFGAGVRLIVKTLRRVNQIQERDE
jgi:F0F1-type ATP synthase assembly protein I